MKSRAKGPQVRMVDSRMHPSLSEAGIVVMSHVLWLSLLTLLLVSCTRASDQAPVGSEPLTTEVRRVVLEDLKLKTDVVGKLKFKGGVNLVSPDSRFGGLSSIQVNENGRNFSTISDRGHRFHGELIYATNGHLVGVTNISIEALQRLQGSDPTEWLDSEATARLPGRGTVISFERNKRLLLYPEGGGPPTLIAAPKELEAASARGGIKALARLPNGQLFALTAGLRTNGGVVGWVGGDKGWSRVTYSIEKELTPTGAAAMPGGDILLVERRLPYIAARLRRLKAAAIQPGAVLKAEELGLLEGSLQVHNIQGVDVRQGKGGKTLIYLVSDDDFIGPQPNAILMFELVE
jgi:hypothetical protein